MQSVHYSSNSIDNRTVKTIKRLLKIEDGNGYKTGGAKQNDDFENIMGELNDKIDMDAINKAV